MTVAKSRLISERFWLKVSKGPGCWEWTGSRDKKGYGHIMSAQRVPLLSHRVSWEFSNGEIPPGLLVLHRCDNPGCVNPAHLFLGTHKDNTRDMLAKGREANGCLIVRGETVHTARLKEHQIPEILAAAAAGERQRSIARRYDVSAGTIFMVIHRLSWKHIP